MTNELTATQTNLLESPLDQNIFLQGPAGSGKTTAGVQRVLQWIDAGVRPKRF